MEISRMLAWKLFCKISPSNENYDMKIEVLYELKRLHKAEGRITEPDHRSSESIQTENMVDI
jgi:hypothetical protein